MLALTRSRFDEPDLQHRLDTYELHIAVGELQYAAYLGDVDGLAGATTRTNTLLAARNEQRLHD